MKTLIILLFLMTFNLFAQEDITIVAVGEAGNEVDIVSIPNLNIIAGFPSDKAIEITSIIKSDFSFYKHLFEVSVDSSKTEGVRYQLDWKLIKQEDKFVLNFGFKDLPGKKTLSTYSMPVYMFNIRSFAHKVSDQLYQSILGKKSIFETKILFTSDRTSKKGENLKELYLMDFDGERKQRITYRNSLIISPAISPDNTKVLYSAFDSKWKKSKLNKVKKVKNLNLYLYDLKTRKEELISNSIGINSGAVFSSDGQSIYLTLSNQKNSDIYKMNLATKVTKRITAHALDDVDPHINNDGSLLTFLSGRSGRAMIYTLDPSGIDKNVKRISYVGKFNSAPRFSPDGKEIVFSSWVDDRFDLYKIGSDGRNLVRLTKNFGSNEEAWFSPDGEFVVFTSQKVISQKKAHQNIYVMNRDGEIVKQLTNNYGKSYTPRWSN